MRDESNSGTDCCHSDDTYTAEQRKNMDCQWELDDSSKLTKAKNLLVRCLTNDMTSSLQNEIEEFLKEIE
jgi:hypothetical protein